VSNSLLSNQSIFDESCLDLMTQNQQKSNLSAKSRSDILSPPPKEILCEVLNLSDISVEWLAGDGSDRCYYRLSSDELNETLVLMQLSQSDAKTLQDDGYDWIKISTLLHSKNVPVPRPVKVIADYAALIIEDYGDIMLESKVMTLSESKDLKTIKSLYKKCFNLIVDMLQIIPDSEQVWTQRSFDQEKYSWELNFFKKQYLEQVLNISFSPKQTQQFEDEVTQISSFLASRSKYFVHRDFHSRNIMCRNTDLALIDFQDARLGAASYDLVSLVFDNYLPFSLDFREELLTDGVNSLATIVDAKYLEDEIKAVILQRQFKAIGTYGFLTKTKMRGDYLRYVSPALSTLTPKFVADARWPFLAEELPALMKKSLPI